MSDLDPVDRPRPVRTGEALDAERLVPWLRRHLPDWEGPLTVLQYPGGHSNLTYHLALGDRSLILRRPPYGTRVATAHDMIREYRILSRLSEVYPKAPRALALCEDPEVLGAPFFLMEKVSGVVLRGQAAPRGVALPPERMRRLSEALVDGLAELHRVDWEGAGLGDLGHPEGYVARQVAGWTRRYQQARTHDLAEMEAVAAWLAAHQPPSGAPAFIHNDFKYDNMVLDLEAEDPVRAVLDWEMATVGDPLMDLGTTLAYWIDPDDPDAFRMLPVGPTTLPGNLRRTEVVARYAEATGRDPGPVLFHYVYGLFKVAVIAQQIYKRYHDGHTQDPRFAAMIMGVTLLSQQAAAALDAGRIDRLG